MKTPQESYSTLQKALGSSQPVFLKREDLHPCGSHKGRSIPMMIRAHHSEGARDFVISSSGNAALAAIHAVQDWNEKNANDKIMLTVYIGKNIDPKKKKKLERAVDHSPSSALIKQVERPKQTAFQADKAGTATNLRQSTDDIALDGYSELAAELADIKNLSAVFIPTSSGTTAEGLAKAFEGLAPHPQIHIVQTSACPPIAEVFDARDTNETTSIAGAIVDNIAHRKQGVIDAVKQSGGSGWIVTNKEIEGAIELAKETVGTDISPNSALSIAGLSRALENGWHVEGAVVCLITGA